MSANNINPVFTQNASPGVAEVSGSTPVLVIQAGIGGMMVDKITALATETVADGKLTLYIAKLDVSFRVILSFGLWPTGGTFTLTVNGITTGPISYSATAAVVQAVLDAALGYGIATVTGGLFVYTISFSGSTPIVSGDFSLLRPSGVQASILLIGALSDPIPYEEIAVKAVTLNSSTPGAKVRSQEITPQTPFWLPPGWQLLASSANSEDWKVWGQGGNCG